MGYRELPDIARIGARSSCRWRHVASVARTCRGGSASTPTPAQDWARRQPDGSSLLQTRMH